MCFQFFKLIKIIRIILLSLILMLLLSFCENLICFWGWFFILFFILESHHFSSWSFLIIGLLLLRSLRFNKSYWSTLLNRFYSHISLFWWSFHLSLCLRLNFFHVLIEWILFLFILVLLIKSGNSILIWHDIWISCETYCTHSWHSLISFIEVILIIILIFFR